MKSRILVKRDALIPSFQSLNSRVSPGASFEKGAKFSLWLSLGIPKPRSFIVSLMPEEREPAVCNDSPPNLYPKASFSKFSRKKNARRSGKVVLLLKFTLHPIFKKKDAIFPRNIYILMQIFNSIFILNLNFK